MSGMECRSNLSAALCASCCPADDLGVLGIVPLSHSSNIGLEVVVALDGISERRLKDRAKRGCEKREPRGVKPGRRVSHHERLAGNKSGRRIE